MIAVWKRNDIVYRYAKLIFSIHLRSREVRSLHHAGDDDIKIFDYFNKISLIRIRFGLKLITISKSGRLCIFFNDNGTSKFNVLRLDCKRISRPWCGYTIVYCATLRLTTYVWHKRYNTMSAHAACNKMQRQHGRGNLF